MEYAYSTLFQQKTPQTKFMKQLKEDSEKRKKEGGLARDYGHED